MKFSAAIQVGLGFAAKTEHKIDVNAQNFVLIPDGYRGSFQDFNVTQLIKQNSEDNLFYKFEERVTT